MSEEGTCEQWPDDIDGFELMEAFLSLWLTDDDDETS